MRVLGRVRLSRLKDESTSVERQRELIENWARDNGHTVVGWAEDLDVSGSTDPFATPSLGPWLTDRLGEWDILCAWKLDRLARRAVPLHRLFGLCQEQNKTLVCVSDNIDLSHWVGRLIASVIAGVAEGELEAIRERTKSSRRKLLETGRWPGGQVPFGFRTTPLPSGGWRLEPDPETAPVVRRIVKEVCSGVSIDSVAESLNKDNMTAPKGGAWIPSTLWKIIESPHLLGHATYEGVTVRDLEGKPVLWSEPILSPSEWDSLTSAVAARKLGSAARHKDVSPMHHVALCAVCETALYHKVYHRDYGPGVYRYYHCRDTSHTSQIRAEIVEELLEEAFLESVGHLNVLERVFQPAENHQIELEDAIRAVDELSALLGTITSDTMRSRLTEQMRALDFRIAALEKLPTRESCWIYQETDENYTQQWNNSDTDQRRELMQQSGITGLFKYQQKVLEFHLRIPAEVETLITKKSPINEVKGKP